MGLWLGCMQTRANISYMLINQNQKTGEWETYQQWRLQVYRPTITGVHKHPREGSQAS